MFSSNLKAALVTVVAGSFSFAKGKKKKKFKKRKTCAELLLPSQEKYGFDTTLSYCSAIMIPKLRHVSHVEWCMYCVCRMRCTLAVVCKGITKQWLSVVYKVLICCGTSR